MFVNLHQHDHHSYYDGFGTSDAHAERAVELGQTALALTNHGNMSGLVEHSASCRKYGIKPILGIEAYFQPEFDKEVPEYYHLTLLAMDLEGYQTLSKIQTIASRQNFHKTPKVTFELLEKFNKGVICLSGCIVGYIPKMIAAKNKVAALEAIKRFQAIFGDRFYLEVMPHNILSQLAVDRALIKLGKRMNIPVVLTLDSHYMSPDDYETYKMMHALKNRDFTNDYSSLYMDDEEGIRAKWSTHLSDIDPTPFIHESGKIADRCTVDLHFEELVPHVDWGMPSKKKLASLAQAGLKAVGKWTDEYKERLKYELEVVFAKRFEDYFLLCFDIVDFAKRHDIGVGYGRGSVCGSLLAYAIGLTNVDPLVLGTSFERFLRPDKNALPDIDMDFDSRRRAEVFDYIQRRYEGRSAPIATYGYYKVRNLANDLGKILGLSFEQTKTAKDKLEKLTGESLSALTAEPTNITRKQLMSDKFLRQLELTTGFVTHFARLYGQIRFIGRHAAGVAVTADDIDKYVPLVFVHQEIQTSYDLKSLGSLNVVKMDILGLSTVSILREAERAAGVAFDYSILDDVAVYEAFAQGRTEGIFQFESRGARGVLAKVRPSTFQELVACTALNRPAPIQLGLLDAYVRGKAGHVDTTSPWYRYTQDTYGQIIYQEHVMNICRNLAHMEWADVDKVMKQLRQVGQKGADVLEQKFVKGAVEHGGLTPKDAKSMYRKMTLYLFNKGHGCGYTLLSFYAMWLKIHYPLEFMYALLKYETDERKRETYEKLAAKLGVFICLPHVNQTAEYSIRVIDGSKVVQSGMLNVKGLGETVALEIVKHQPYTSEADMFEKLPKKIRNVKVMAGLQGQGATEFNINRWLQRCERHNRLLYAGGIYLDEEN